MPVHMHIYIDILAPEDAHLGKKELGETFYLG